MTHDWTRNMLCGRNGLEREEEEKTENSRALPLLYLVAFFCNFFYVGRFGLYSIYLKLKCSIVKKKKKKFGSSVLGLESRTEPNPSVFDSDTRSGF